MPKPIKRAKGKTEKLPADSVFSNALSKSTHSLHAIILLKMHGYLTEEEYQRIKSRIVSAT